MKTIEDEVNELYKFVVDSLDRVEINKWGDTYSVSIGNGDIQQLTAYGFF